MFHPGEAATPYSLPPYADRPQRRHTPMRASTGYEPNRFSDEHGARPERRGKVSKDDLELEKFNVLTDRAKIKRAVTAMIQNVDGAFLLCNQSRTNMHQARPTRARTQPPSPWTPEDNELGALTPPPAAGKYVVGYRSGLHVAMGLVSAGQCGLPACPHTSTQTTATTRHDTYDRNGKQHSTGPSRTLSI